MEWTADNLISLTSEVAWPIVVLVIAWKLKGSFLNVVQNFLTGNKVTEVSVGVSGITAKMEAKKQAPDSLEEKNLKRLYLEAWI